MSPASNEAPSTGLSLPAPQPEQIREHVGLETAPARSEQTSTVAERVPQPSQAMPAVALPAWPVAIPIDDQTTAGNDVSNASASATTRALDDKDLIDKVVVEKAKAIVARNSDDPYKQTQELTTLKAEFLQQNYNKAIKLDS